MCKRHYPVVVDENNDPIDEHYVVRLQGGAYGDGYGKRALARIMAGTAKISDFSVWVLYNRIRVEYRKLPKEYQDRYSFIRDELAERESEFIALTARRTRVQQELHTTPTGNNCDFSFLYTPRVVCN